MKHLLSLTLAALCAVLLPLTARAEEAVKKDPVTNALTEPLSIGTQTITFAAGATSVWESGHTVTNPGFARASLGLTIGNHVQAYDADLTQWATVTPSAFMLSLADDPTAGDFLATLGFSTYVKTLLDDLTAGDFLTTLGVSAYVKGLLDDPTAGDFLTTLGFSAFAKTLLDDADAAAVRATVAAARTDGTNTFTGAQTISDTTQSVSPTTGALKVAGGAGVQKTLYVGEGIEAAGVISGAGFALPGYLHGFDMATDSTDPTNDVVVNAGQCMGEYAPDRATQRRLINGGGGVKRIDATWAQGSNAGGLDSGSVTNATYHVHAIGGDSATPDVIFSLSHDEHCTVTMTNASPCVVTWTDWQGRGHGLQAGSPVKFRTTSSLPTGVTAGTQYYVIATGLTATTFRFSTSIGGSAVNTSSDGAGIQYCYAGPDLTLPGSNYKYYRRIGSVIRSGGSNLAFIQDGDDFLLVTPVVDVAVTNLSTSRVTYTLASAPVGLRMAVKARCLFTHNSVGTLGWVGDLSTTDAAPHGSNSPLATHYVHVGAGMEAQDLIIMMNTSAQIAARSSASSSTLRVATLGWKDTRGKGRYFFDGQ